MQKILLFFIACLFTSLSFAQTPVEEHGQLHIKGNRVLDKNDDTVQFKGMSLFWSQWEGDFYNYKCIKWLRDDWKSTIIRAAIAVENGGISAEQEKKADSVVMAAINLGIYVVIDWHEVAATLYTTQAQTFFVKMAKKYGSYPNVIYEPFNEPNGPNWATLKPYFQAVIDSIREYDKDNIIVCGTPNWSQFVDEAAASPLPDTNVAYTLHYYAASHKDWLRSRAQTALDKGCALFVTEYGISEASGSGTLDYAEGLKWYNFLDKNSISYCNWSLCDKNETSAALVPGASVTGGWDSASISKSGWFVRADMRGDTFIIPQPPKPSQVKEYAGGNLKVYPNPTTGEVKIELPENIENAEINVYDNSGRLMLFEKLSSTKSSINISNLEKGIYKIRIISGNKLFISSVIRN